MNTFLGCVRTLYIIITSSNIFTFRNSPSAKSIEHAVSSGASIQLVDSSVIDSWIVRVLGICSRKDSIATAQEVCVGAAEGDRVTASQADFSGRVD